MLSIVLTGVLPASASDAQIKVLWDGDTQPVGVGWVSPTGKAMSAGVEHRSATTDICAVFHCAQAKTFVECGWQWANWSPAFTGTDITPYDTLEFDLRLDGTNLPPDLLLSLAAPGDHNCTGRIALRKYAATLTDGKWHTLHIPLQDLYSADRADYASRFPGSAFDARHTIQVIFGTWNDQGDFRVSLDNLRLVSIPRHSPRKQP